MTLTDLIEATLRDHSVDFGDHQPCCSCGHDYVDFQGIFNRHRAHVAERIAEALNVEYVHDEPTWTDDKQDGQVPLYRIRGLE